MNAAGFARENLLRWPYNFMVVAIYDLIGQLGPSVTREAYPRGLPDTTLVA